MVRLMLVLAPVMCILSGIAVSHLLSSFMKNLDLVEARGSSGKKKKNDAAYPYKNEVAMVFLGVMTTLLISYSFHCTWVSLYLSIT